MVDRRLIPVHSCFPTANDPPIPAPDETEQVSLEDSQGLVNRRSPLPLEFLHRIQSIVPAASCRPVLDSFEITKQVSFRINELVRPASEVLTAIAELAVPIQPVEWLTNREGVVLAYWTTAEFKSVLTHSPLADEGSIYLQNLSSMLAPYVLNPQPGETVLDLAAAPGGKTIQMAQQMLNQGHLSAVEAVRNRMFKLQANLKRGNVLICKTYLTDGRTVGNKTPGRFDRILLDAPCSSEARIHCQNPQSWSTWSLRKLRETSRKQIGLLKAAIRAVKPGGMVLYCTCSFAPEENEQVVDKVLRKFGDAVALEPIELPIANQQPGLTSFGETEYDPRLSATRRVLPDHLMDAFYLAKLVKNLPTD
jgi:16S rRNA C967 or C1407 C5-methylase (RsmB/RsmF family)